METGNSDPPANHDKIPPEPEISHLTRREIQAPVAACLIRGFADVVGLDKAVEAATAAVQADAEKAGREMAEKYGDNSIEVLASILRELWTADGAMTIEVLEQTGQKLSFDVTRCGYAEMYEKEGMKDLGFCLSCSRDEPFTKGFNPRMKLRRSRTIMEGESQCDFRFVLE